MLATMSDVTSRRKVLPSGKWTRSIRLAPVAAYAGCR